MSTMIALIAADDHRHELNPGEHEAFYFLFTSSDGKVHGFVRTLFDREAVLELVALHSGGRAWVHQRRAALPGGPAPAADASDPALKLTCVEPWQAWRCFFQGTVRGVVEETTLAADIDLAYAATNEPACYGFGPYHQAQQDGWLSGRLRVGTETRTGELLCYRDHSWGQRPMGAAVGWTIVSAPGHFYVVVADMGSQPMCFGRFTTPDGQFAPVRAPRIAALDDGWCIEDAEAGWGAWRMQRLAPPLVAYLGPAGQESLCDGPGPGDLYRDEIGPALFTAPGGREFVGFWDQASRLREGG
jgi:hypothetical protein